MSTMLPGSWRPRISASDHMFIPSTPELLNSGMLAGVDTSLYLWGGVLLPVFRVVCSPASIPEFRNSGFSNRATHVLAAHCHCTHLSCTGPLHCPGRALNSHRCCRLRPGPGHHRLHHQATIPAICAWGAWCQRPLRRNLLDLLHLVDVLAFLRCRCCWL